MKYKNFLISIILSVLLVAAFYDKPIVRKYEVDVQNQKLGSECDIVVLADVHNTEHGLNQNYILSKIEKLEPDAILLVGDMISNFSAKANTIALIDGLSDIAPMYYVTGNHEFWTYKAEKIIDLLKERGVTVLRNESIKLEINGIQVTLCGTDDPDVIYYSDDKDYKNMINPDELLEVFENLEPKEFNLLMAHRPERIESYLKYDFDLIVSGHAHGGQVRVPFLINGLFAPNQGWFPKYAGGLYKQGDTVHIVSRGLSVQPSLPRIFNPPEIVHIKLKCK